MSDADIFGRKLLASIAAELSAVSDSLSLDNQPEMLRHYISAGIIMGLSICAKNFPFEATGIAHLQLAETIIQSYLSLSGATEEVEASRKRFAIIKAELQLDGSAGGSNGRQAH